MSHTPGPWEAVEIIDHISVESKKQTIATFFTYQENYLSNANLIAAAPEMLEALKNIENDDQRLPNSAWGLIQKAIAKAEGKQ